MARFRAAILKLVPALVPALVYAISLAVPVSSPADGAVGLPLGTLPGIGILSEGGRQPFGDSGVTDPLRGLGKQPNALDAPIQGDLDRYRDDLVPVPALPPIADPTPPPELRPIHRPVRPSSGLGLGQTSVGNGAGGS